MQKLFRRDTAEEQEQEYISSGSSQTNDIYVMPEEFYEPLHQKKGLTRLKLVLLLIGLIILALGVGFGYVYLMSDGDTSLITEEKVDTTDSSDEDTDTLFEDDRGEPIATTTEAEGDSDDFMHDEEEESIFEEVAVLPDSLDIDQDGLTDIEEVLLGTDIRNADSDGDGFLDGSEFLAGYDPLISQERFFDSDSFQVYVNFDPRFELKLPLSWQQLEQASPSVKSFGASNGDIVSITVFEKTGTFVFDAWLRERFPGKHIRDYEGTVFGELPGYYSQASREAVIELDTHIMMLVYDVGKKVEVAYPTVWQYILSTVK